MVGQRQPSLYELLEVSHAATFEEIEQSYQRIAAYLGAESLAVYSILDSDDAHTARAQLDEAYRTLSDPDRRAAYDRSRKEDYPSIMVPANTGGSTSTADAHDPERIRPSAQEERDKRLPVIGRSQNRAPIRGPAAAARTGRTPLYGRDVGRSAKANESPEVERKKKPLYGRAPSRPVAATPAPPPEGPRVRYVTEEPSRQPTTRWSTRGDDSPQQLEPPAPSPRHAVDDEPVRTEAVQRDAFQDDARREPEVPVQALPPAPAPRVVERQPERVQERVERQQERVERTELVKTASDVVEPRKRPTMPPPASLSANATSKRRILSPSVALELTGDVEFGGSLLRRLRESTGASLEEVAEITKVGKRHLIAIETNDFAALPAAVYTRGFVAEYARVLGLDVNRVTKSFMTLYAKYRGVGG